MYHKKKKKSNSHSNSNTQTPFRIRLLHDKEVLGIVEERLGASRVRVRCMDDKERICRIPGRLKRFLWVRPGDTVIVEPWEYGGDKKGDIVFKYRRSEIQYLSKRGYLKGLQELDEF